MGSKAVIRRQLAAVATPATAVDGDLTGAAARLAPDAVHLLAFMEVTVDPNATGHGEAEAGSGGMGGSSGSGGGGGGHPLDGEDVGRLSLDGGCQLSATQPIGGVDGGCQLSATQPIGGGTSGGISLDGGCHLSTTQPIRDGGGGRGMSADVDLGFAYLDAAAGQLHVGSLRDDAARTALATLLSQVYPNPYTLFPKPYSLNFKPKL